MSARQPDRPYCETPRRSIPWLCLALLWLAGCSADQQPVNVLLIVVDTLRADHLGCYGAGRDTSPNLDALAASGVRFERAYTVSPWTMPSVASVLTGLHPSSHGLINAAQLLPEKARTLSEILRDAGYVTGAVVSHQLISSTHHYDQGFDVFDDSEVGSHNSVSTPGVTRRARELLSRWAAGDQPFFLLVHYFDPHYNYRRHAKIGFAAERAGRLDGTQRIQKLRELGEGLTGEERTFLKDLYDEEIRFTDEGIGELLEELSHLGLTQDTLVVVTADHGEEFLERGWLGHVRTLYDELMRVPLIVRLPGASQDGAIVTDPVSLVALTPTILDLAGVDFEDEDFEAHSLASVISEGGSVTDAVLLEVDYEPIGEKSEKRLTHKKGLVQGDMKLIRDDLSGVIELYDLEADPAERDDLAAVRPKQVAELLDRLEQFLSWVRRSPLSVEIDDVDDETLEQLRELGYVGGGEEPGGG